MVTSVTKGTGHRNCHQNVSWNIPTWPFIGKLLRNTFWWYQKLFDSTIFGEENASSAYFIKKPPPLESSGHLFHCWANNLIDAVNILSLSLGHKVNNHSPATPYILIATLNIYVAVEREVRDVKKGFEYCMMSWGKWVNVLISCGPKAAHKNYGCYDRENKTCEYENI
jgi:hypothetical protein